MLSSDGGVIPLREIDQRLKITSSLVKNLIDPRDKNLITYSMSELLRTRLYLIAQGWNDADDADLLRHDPALRIAVSSHKGQTPLKPENTIERTPDGLASQPTLSRLTEILATDNNRKTLRQNLAEITRRSIKATRKHRYRNVTIDIDSFPIETYGYQMGSLYNGYYKHKCYHPLVAMLAETGDIIDVMLRDGNVHTADDLSDFLFPLIDNVHGKIGQVTAVRGDAGMPSEKILSQLEQRHLQYVFRIKSNPVLKRMAEPFLADFPLNRADGQDELTVELVYQAESWSCPRRIVLVIVAETKQINLFEPYNYFFLVTGWKKEPMSGHDLLEFYRRRGTMERWIGEFKDVLRPALSCAVRPRSADFELERDDFACNEALLLLYALAYNLLNIARRLMEKATGVGWSLRRLREQVLKAALHVTLHARVIKAWITTSSSGFWWLLSKRIAGLHPV